MYTIPTLSRTAMHYTYNTTTTDSIPDGLLTGTTLFDKSTVSYSYDHLQRLSNKLLKSESGTTLLEERFAYAAGSGENTTTNRVSTKRNFWNGSLINQFQHGYDVLGNITSVYDAKTGKRVNYTYDDQGQLLQADHIENGTTVTRIECYTYDNVGNILTFNNGTTSHTYTYGDTQWRDLLTAVDGNEITYDASGNPTEYYNEWPITWVEGRRLESVTTTEGKYTYEYNADGQRIKKTNPDGSYTEYYVMNGITVGERRYSADKTTFQNIRYTLDENNSVIGISVSTGSGWDNYYFTKNLQGDVLEVYNASTNEIVAQYTYDSWGNILTSTGNMKDTNPFRYRSYYYDEETNFYYLQSRYYDASIGRFINADIYSSTGQGVLGNNMFAYCINNPVNLCDPSGAIPLYDHPIQKATEDFFQWYWTTDENEVDENGQYTIAAKSKRTINSFVQNFEFSCGVGYGMSCKIVAFDMGFDAGGYYNLLNFRYADGNLEFGQEFNFGITGEVMKVEVGASVNSFMQGNYIVDCDKFLLYNKDQDSITLTSGAAYIVMGGSYRIGYDLNTFLYELDDIW